MFLQWYTVNTTFTAPGPKWAMAKRRRVEEQPEHPGGDDAAWEAEALAAGLRDKKGVRVCCMSGIRHQCQNVNTQNERHRAGTRKHTLLSTIGAAPLYRWWNSIVHYCSERLSLDIVQYWLKLGPKTMQCVSSFEPMFDALGDLNKRFGGIDDLDEP